jgi:hypothetical protein
MFGAKPKISKWLASKDFREFMSHVQKDYANMDISQIFGGASSDIRVSGDIHLIGHSSIGGEVSQSLK